MKRSICLLVVLFLVPRTAGAADKKTGDLTDPVEILKKVDAAAKAVHAVKYEFSLEGTGAAKNFVPSIRAFVIAAGAGEGGLARAYRCDASITRPGSDKTKRVVTGGDGENYYLIDHDSKKAYVDMDPGVVGRTGGLVMQGMMHEFLHPEPFSDELNGDKQELTGSKKIAGEDCYEVHVVYTGGREAIWYFSKKDFLPRARHNLFTRPTGEKGASIKVVKNLVVDPKLDKDAFAFTLPNGYTQVDDFAPN